MPSRLQWHRLVVEEESIQRGATKMQSVRGLTGADYAKYALLVIYAWDMCDQDQNPASDNLDTRIAADGWRVVGIITGADNVLATAPTAPQATLNAPLSSGAPQPVSGLRQSVIQPGRDVRRYGYLAANAGNDTFVAVIRGTDGAEEWADDCVFIAKQQAPFPGRVESGFIDIFMSMEYRPLGGGASVPLAAGIQSAVSTADVLVLGHSLGSTLAEALAFELAAPASLGPTRVGAIMYASPKLGDHDFAIGFDARVTNYTVLNYEHDVVPTVPPFDITHFDLYRPLLHVFVITDEMATAVINFTDKGCCHHLIDYIATLSPPVFNQSKATWTADEISCAQCVLSLR
jgi:triacylglycerol lipase